MMDGGIFLRFKVGSQSTAAANVSYILRGSATEWMLEAVITQNYPTYIIEGEAYKEIMQRITEYNRQQEQYELARGHTGTGKTRTHYRAVASFEGKIDTAIARDLAKEWVEKNFPKSRAVVAVHQDTQHTHAHINIQARGIDGKKIDISAKGYHNLDTEWAKIYAREFGQEKLEQHLAKKGETQEYKKAQALGQIKAQPVRSPKKLLRSKYEQRERANNGIKQSRVGRDQSRLATREPATGESKLSASRAEREIASAERAISRSTEQLNRTVQAGRDALQSVKTIRDRIGRVR